MHPALRWVSNPSKLGQGGEAHVLDAPPAEWDKIVKAGRYGAWGVTAPEAQESHKIVDCEFPLGFSPCTLAEPAFFFLHSSSLLCEKSAIKLH